MSISLKLNSLKKSLTALLGAALVAGSLVATTPASAAETSTMKQPKDIVSLGNPIGDYSRSGDLVIRGGWAYTLQAPEQNYWYGATPNTTLAIAGLNRLKLSTFTTSTPYNLFPMDHSATSTATATSGAIASTYSPQAFDITPDGNTAFIVDGIKDNSYTYRVIKVDLSGATNDTDVNLAGQVVATKSSIYSGVTGVTALDDATIFIVAQNQIIKGTRSGSTWTFATTSVTGTPFDAKLNTDNNLVVATSSQSSVTLTTYNPSTMAIVGSAQTVSLGTSSYVYTTAGITIDSSNGDVLLVDGEGSRIRRVVNQSGTYNSTVKFEAMKGVKSYSATAMAPSGSNYTFTVASTTGVKVGSSVYLGTILANEVNAYVNTNGGNAMTVTSVTSTTITVTSNSTPFSIMNGTLRSAELLVQSPLSYVTALAVDNSVGGQGLLALDHGTTPNTTPAVGPALVNFETHNLPLTGSSMSVNGGHKSISINYSGPRVGNDIKTYEAYLFSGTTLDLAVSAAQAHTESVSVTCTFAGNGYNGQSFNCTAVDGIIAGKYYALAVKQIAFDGITSWTIPGATTNNRNSAAAQAVDSAVTLTLPTDPDPAGPASPGFAHEGPSSTDAMSLLGSAYQHLVQDDGQGGRYIAYKVGNTVAAEYKLIHLKNNGQIDSTFGTSGIQTLSAQSSSLTGNRNVQLGWYGNGKFVFSDYDAANNIYNFNFATANGVNGWKVTLAEADAFCAANVTGENNASSNSVNLIPAAGSDPIVSVTCNVNWRNQNYNSVNIGNYPVIAKLTADHTLTALAVPFSNITSYDTANATTDKVCLNSWANQGVGVISDPNPTASGTLFTVLYKANALSSGGFSRDCYSNASSSIGRSLTVKADGTSAFTDNGLAGGNSIYPTVVGTGVTKGHNFYMWAKESWNSPTKIYRFNGEGVLDNTFGDQGKVTMSNPTCSGTYLTTAGLAENNAGDVYLTNISNFGLGSSAKLYATSQLLEKSSGNAAEIGGTHISAPVGISGNLNIDVPGTLSEYGKAFSGVAIDADGNTFIAYYASSTTLKSVKFDSFAGALATGEDYMDCPPAPFEAVTATPPFEAYSPGAIVKNSDTTLFMYDLDNESKASATFTYGTNPKAGRFTNNEVSLDRHSGGFMVALADGKVLVGGGSYSEMSQATNWMSVDRITRTVEIYDPSAAAGSRWTRLSDAQGNDILPNETRAYPHAVLLGNGKVLVYGGTFGSMGGNMNTPRGGRTSALVITIGAAGASSIATVEIGATYSHAVSAGTGKWLLFGNAPDADYMGIPLVSTTKVFTESSGAVSDGPALKSARRDPVVVPLSNGKVIIAGDSCMGMCMQSDSGTYDLYDPATNRITSSANLTRGTSPNMSPGFSSISGGIELASGKILLLPSSMNMGMSPGASTAWLFNPSNNSFAAADIPVAAAEGQSLYRVGEKVLIAGGAGSAQTTPWQVYTQPVVVEPLSYTADNRRVLKGSTGNLTISSSQAFTLGAGGTQLQVIYSNEPGSNVLKAPVTVLSAKLKLDATSTKLTLALPTAAQMNANGVGAIRATIQQGINPLGSVVITYIAAKDTPVFQGQIQPGVPRSVPGANANVPLGLTTLIGNGIPTLSYKSNTAKVCSVAANGTVTRLARGECQIVVSQAADLGTNAVSQTYKLNFQKSTAVLQFGQGTPAAGNLDLIEDDRQIVLAPTVDGAPAAGLDVDYSVDNDAACSISDEGVLNTIAVGSCKVTVTFAGNADITGPVVLERTYSIVVPAQPVDSQGTVGGTIGDAVFEAKDDPADDLLTVALTMPKGVAKNIKLGRGWSILYTPTVKNGAVTGATFIPSITSQLIGSISTTFIIPASSFAKVPAGWTALPKPTKTVVATTYQCVLSYGSKTQVAASKKIKTVVSKGKTCALPALSSPLQVKVKNNWTRLAQKKGSAAVTPQKRTAKINLQ